MENQDLNPKPPVVEEPMASVGPKSESGMGSVVSTIIIIALIILGGLYFWGKRMEKQRAGENLILNKITADETAAVSDAVKIQTVSENDDLKTLENELNQTNISSVDSNI